MILRALLIICVAQAMQDAGGEALGDRLSQGLARLQSRLLQMRCGRRRQPTEEEMETAREKAVEALQHALEPVSENLSEPVNQIATRTVQELGDADISYLVANAMPEKEFIHFYSSMNKKQFQDTVSKMGHLADPDVLGIHLLKDYYHATKNAVMANPEQETLIYAKAIGKVLMGGAFVAGCTTLQSFLEARWGKIDEEPSISYLVWAVPLIMTFRMTASGLLFTPASALTSAYLGYIIPDPNSKVLALVYGNWVAAMIPLGLYNSFPRFYKKHVLKVLSTNPGVSWVWQLTFAYHNIAKAGISGILIGHGIFGGGCVAYWFQPEISNSITDMVGFGSAGLSEDVFLVLFGATATAASYTVLFTGFITVNAMKLFTTPSKVQKAIALLKSMSISFLIYQLHLNDTSLGHYLNSIPVGVKPLGAIYCGVSTLINLIAHCFGGDTYANAHEEANFDQARDALLNSA